MSFNKYPKIKPLGYEENKEMMTNPNDDIYIQEKMDGANFRFMITKDNRIVFGSRNRSIGNDTQEIGGNWRNCVQHIKDKCYQNMYLSSYQNYIFYGECMIKHSMEYNWNQIPIYLGYDVYDIIKHKFLKEEQARGIFKDLELDFVPTHGIIPAFEASKLTEKDVPKSKYAEEQAEGIVLKNYNKQLMAKIVTAKFKEVNIATFGGSKKWATNDNDRIVAMYCTNPRIDKQIFQLKNTGYKLELKMMEKLPIQVYKDIMEEHGNEILYSRYNIDFAKLKKKITKRCLHVLQQIITLNKQT